MVFKQRPDKHSITSRKDLAKRTEAAVAAAPPAKCKGATGARMPISFKMKEYFKIYTCHQSIVNEVYLTVFI